jgi:tetratricopeptide (TPR) repeat protein
MSSERHHEFMRAGWAAYAAGHYVQAAKFYRKARELAEQERDHGEAVHAGFWMGTSHRLAGDYENALPVLLAVAHSTAPEADPADVINALTTAAEIVIEIKSARLARALIDDGWRQLERLGNEAWGHLLWYIDGLLACEQGDFERAMQAQLRGWAIHVEDYPYYTSASHLWELCRCSFMLRNRVELKRWVEALDNNEHELDLDRMQANLGRLLELRSREHPATHAIEAVHAAREVLRRADGFELSNHRWRYKLDALRVLAFYGYHDDAGPQLAESSETRDFDLELFWGDLALARARACLGMDPRDDEWDVEFPAPQPPYPDLAAARAHLAVAREHFIAANSHAVTKDQRLETRYYTITIAERLQRVESLAHLLD